QLGRFVLLVSSECGGIAFMFSSRRRHTSFSRDWSSDVCSSDLYDMSSDRTETRDLAAVHPDIAARMAKQWDYWAAKSFVDPWPKIGRASCRERVRTGLGDVRAHAGICSQDRLMSIWCDP